MNVVDGEDIQGDTADAWQTLDLVNGWLKHAEAKAGVALATVGVLGGLLYNLAASLKEPPWWVIAPMVGAILFMAVGGMCAAVAVVPRLWRKDSATSRIYYDHIARAYPKKPKSEVRIFQNEFARIIGSKKALFDELSAQVWTNSHVAATKFMWGTWAIVCVIVAAFCVALVACGVAWDLR